MLMSEDKAGKRIGVWLGRKEGAVFYKMDRGTSPRSWHLSPDFSQVTDKALGGSKQISPGGGDCELQRLWVGNKLARPEEQGTCL